MLSRVSGGARAGRRLVRAFVQPASGNGSLGDQRCVFLGAGRMAEAMIRGLLKSGPDGAHAAISADRITAIDINADRLKLFENLGLRTIHDDGSEHSGPGRLAWLNFSAQGEKLKTALQEADVVVLAVKPQQAEKAIDQVAAVGNDKAVFMSICAGISVDTLAKSGLPAVVRAMPNTPALIGHGMTVWYANKGTSKEQIRTAESVMGTLGVQMRAGEEHYLDKATALSGTGPAYFFLTMEAMVEAGVHMGFQREVARQIVVQTAKGAALLAEETARMPADLRSDITSPAGTTAEAVYFAERGAFRTVISDAVWSAYRRSLELGGTVETKNVGPVPR